MSDDSMYYIQYFAAHANDCDTRLRAGRKSMRGANFTTLVGVSACGDGVLPRQQLRCYDVYHAQIEAAQIQYDESVR